MGAREETSRRSACSARGCVDTRRVLDAECDCTADEDGSRDESACASGELAQSTASTNAERT